MGLILPSHLSLTLTQRLHSPLASAEKAVLTHRPPQQSLSSSQSLFPLCSDSLASESPRARSDRLRFNHFFLVVGGESFSPLVPQHSLNHRVGTQQKQGPGCPPIGPGLPYCVRARWGQQMALCSWHCRARCCWVRLAQHLRVTQVCSPLTSP